MMPRMRTIQEAAAELRALDPGTAVTPHMIRRLVLEGMIPHVNAGCKRLISLDGLLAYLAAPSAAQAPSTASSRPQELIRPVSE